MPAPGDPAEPGEPLPTRQIGHETLPLPQLPQRLLALPAQQAALAQLQGQPPRLLELVDLPRAVRLQPVCRVRRQRQADRRLLQGRAAVPGARRLSGVEVRRLPGGHRLQGPGNPRGDGEERLGHLAADQLLLPFHQQGLSAHQECERPVPGVPRAAAVVDQRHLLRRARRPHGALHGHRQPQLARHRRPGPRRAGAPDLRLPRVRAVRTAADHPVLHRRGDRRRHAGLFRRPRRSRLPALPRDLVVDPLAVRAHHHLLRPGARLLDAARRAPALPLGLSRRRGARRVPARTQLRVHHGGARARPLRRQDHVQAPAAERHGGDPDVPALQAVRLDHGAHRARLPGARPAARLRLAGRAAGPGQGQPAGALAGPDRLHLDRRAA